MDIRSLVEKANSIREENRKELVPMASDIVAILNGGDSNVGRYLYTLIVTGKKNPYTKSGPCWNKVEGTVTWPLYLDNMLVGCISCEVRGKEGDTIVVVATPGSEFTLDRWGFPTAASGILILDTTIKLDVLGEAIARYADWLTRTAK